MSYPESNSAKDAFYNPYGAHSHVATRDEEIECLHKSKWFNELSKKDQKVL